ncbi:hypothetical protein C8Q76DRAFT_227260 [Earliella scabrosa]|nr:hypothetical protein C8Q76DRAFT_227260 [Earliella scabrosa]
MSGPICSAAIAVAGRWRRAHQYSATTWMENALRTSHNTARALTAALETIILQRGASSAPFRTLARQTAAKTIGNVTLPQTTLRSRHLSLRFCADRLASRFILCSWYVERFSGGTGHEQEPSIKRQAPSSNSLPATVGYTSHPSQSARTSPSYTILLACFPHIMDAFFTISPPVPVEAPHGDTYVSIDHERGNLGSGHSGCVIVWCVLLKLSSDV